MSDYPKIQPEISQPISENLQKLASLFPAAVKDGELDIEALREELGDFAEIQPGDEKYELNWVGKQASKKKAFEPLLGKTLALKDDGKNTDTTENLYIEGDNLEALKLLRQNYYGEVKMIYIDPPYNTGKDFIYTDKFKVSQEESEEEEGAISESGGRLVKNEKSSNRFHSRWLDMIYPILKTAKSLLREDGVIFISIDDNEAYNLKEICDEIYGSENFLGMFSVTSSPSAIDYGHIAKTNDYCLFYSNNVLKTVTNQLIDVDKVFKYNDKESGFNIYPLYNGNTAFNPDTRPNLHYPFYVNPLNMLDDHFYEIGLDKKEGWVEVFPVVSKKEGISRVWRWGKQKSSENLNNEIVGHLSESGEYRIVQKSRLTGKVIRSVIDDKSVSSRRGTAELDELFKTKLFPFPKPTALVKRFAEVGTTKQDIILDFFSGSGTSAHAVMQLNALDGGSRKHIMVQLPEVCDAKSEAAKAGYQTIAEIGKERIRRAGDKIVEELRAKKEELEKNGELDLGDSKNNNPYILNPDSLDIGFKSFRIEDTKINWLKKDLRGEDLEAEAGLTTADALDFVPGFTDTDVVYELMLRQSNIPLTLSITQPIDGSERTYLYGDSYIICLEESISKELVEQLAALEPTPLKYFFRDSAFGKDIAFKDETFRRLNAEIAKKTADQADAYTVEFI